MTNKIFKQKALSSILIGVLCSIFIVALVTIFPAFFERWHLKIADSLYTLSGHISKDIVIIAIDEDSTRPIPLGAGRFSQWDRDNYAKLLTELEADKPKAVVFDLLFNNPAQNVNIEKIAEFYNQTSDESNLEKLQSYEDFFQNNSSTSNIPEDNQFAEAISTAGNVILEFAANENEYIVPLQKFSKDADLAVVMATPDFDGVFRRIPVHYTVEDGTQYDSLSLAGVKALTGDDSIEVPLEDGKMLINYFGDPFSYEMVSFNDVVKGNVLRGTFKDKLVFVGLTSFKEVQDFAITPRSNEMVMPGVEIHANAAQTILDRAFLRNQSGISLIVLIFGLAVGLSVLLAYLGPVVSVVTVAFAFFAYIGSAKFFYQQGVIINMIQPFMAIILTSLTSWVFRYFVADKGKREITQAFSHYVSDELVDQISKNPDIVKLGGEKKQLTVFFSDIKNSTAQSEKHEIVSWVRQMNEYFTVMESIIRQNGGTLDKYEGDGIMGFWNAPINQENHVFLAYKSALDMQQALAKLHGKWAKEGKPLLEFRMGINTGEAVVGNFGSINHFDYTVMGDTVNVASRLESSANKTYGTELVIAGFDDNLSAEDRNIFVIRELDTVLLPGKSEALVIFELVGFRDGFDLERMEELQKYEEGLALYRQQKFEEALVIFSQLSEDNPAKVMAERCRKILAGTGQNLINQDMVFHIMYK